MPKERGKGTGSKWDLSLQKRPNTVTETLTLGTPLFGGGNSNVDLGKISFWPFGPPLNLFSSAEDFQAHFRYNGGQVKCNDIARGAYGRVMMAVADTGPAFTIKIQERTPEALKGLQTAMKLQHCNLVSFRPFDLTSDSESPLLATCMELMGGDCSKLGFGNSDRGAARKKFVNFLDDLKACLFEYGATFTDMKPENVGFKQTNGVYQFTLLDLDGLNDNISTYPMTARMLRKFGPVLGFTTRQQKMSQTAYAVEVTKLLVCADGTQGSDDIWKSLSWTIFSKRKGRAHESAPFRSPSEKQIFMLRRCAEIMPNQEARAAAAAAFKILKDNQDKMKD